MSWPKVILLLFSANFDIMKFNQELLNNFAFKIQLGSINGKAGRDR